MGLCLIPIHTEDGGRCGLFQDTDIPAGVGFSTRPIHRPIPIPIDSLLDVAGALAGTTVMTVAPNWWCLRWRVYRSRGGDFAGASE